jgi:hypothetical protein
VSNAEFLTLDDVAKLLRRITVSNLYRPTEDMRKAHWECESILRHRAWNKRSFEPASVYIIQSGGRRGPVKIGVTRNATRRRVSLQTGSARQLRTLWVIEGVGRHMEKWLHSYLSKARMHGEWFRFTPDVAEYLRVLKLIKRLGRRRGNRPSS